MEWKKNPNFGRETEKAADPIGAKMHILQFMIRQKKWVYGLLWPVLGQNMTCCNTNSYLEQWPLPMYWQPTQNTTVFDQQWPKQNSHLTDQWSCKIVFSVLNALKSFGCLCPSCSTSSASSQDLLGP
jgi:hypothetical protein